MTALANTCEGTSGSNTPATSIGAPDAFTDRSVSGTGATQTFDNTHSHGGTTSIKEFSPQTVATTNYVEWASEPSTANIYLRIYIYLTANPSVNTGIFRLQGSGATRASLAITTGGQIRTLNNAGGSVATSTATIPLNAWARVEFEVTGISGTTGTINARLYSGSNRETNTADTGGTLTNSGVTVGGNVDGVRIGNTGSTFTGADFSMWIDDVAYSDVSQPGPVAPPDTTATGGTATAAGPNFTRTMLVRSETNPALPPGTAAGGTASITTTYAGAGAATATGPDMDLEIDLAFLAGQAFAGGGAAVALGLGPPPPTDHPPVGGIYNANISGGIFNQGSSGGQVLVATRGGRVDEQRQGGEV